MGERRMQRESAKRRPILKATFGLGLMGFALLALLAKGCSSPSGNTGPTPERSKAFAGVVLKIACPVGTASQVIERYSKVWVLETGAEVRLLPVAGDQEPPPADMWIIPAARMPHFAAAGRIQPVPQAYTERGHEYFWDNL